jgi:ADP-heptose:LPS heptosyltransferase
MKKAFYINGGAGRVLAAIPALEHHIKHIDPTVVIIVEGWLEICLLNKAIMHNVYPHDHPDLIEKLRDREVISPEPYRLNAYFNQKCNLSQAFDMLINYDVPPEEVPADKDYNMFISKADVLVAQNLLQEINSHTKKDKFVVFQPFGSTAKAEGNYIIDESGRSFETEDIIQIVEELNKHYAVIMMGEIKIPGLPKGVIVPEEITLLQWTAIIHAADYFIGCDSVGQHIAHAIEKPGTVVIGSTFPENTSYTSGSTLKIIDNGVGRKMYSPIRMTYDIRIEKNNEYLMKLDDKTINKIISNVKAKLGTKKTTS